MYVHLSGYKRTFHAMNYFFNWLNGQPWLPESWFIFLKRMGVGHLGFTMSKAIFCDRKKKSWNSFTQWRPLMWRIRCSSDTHLAHMHVCQTSLGHWQLSGKWMSLNHLLDAQFWRKWCLSCSWMVMSFRMFFPLGCRTTDACLNSFPSQCHFKGLDCSDNKDRVSLGHFDKLSDVSTLWNQIY